MNINNKREAIDLFINSSIENVKLFGGENHKLSNKHYKLMKIAYNYLMENDDINELNLLLDFPNYGVQLWAASFFGKTNMPKVETVLKKIIEMKIPHISLSAEYTLQELNEDAGI